MTSGTDELLRLLDERGVEWTYEDGTVSFNDGKRWFHAWAYNDGAMCVSMGYLTPAQAIAATVGSDKVEAVLRKLIAQLGVAADFHFARKYVDCIVEEYAGKLATLGAGTCKRVMDSIDPFAMWVCDHCGHPLDTSENFCGGCGRRIEQ